LKYGSLTIKLNCNFYNIIREFYSMIKFDNLTFKEATNMLETPAAGKLKDFYAKPCKLSVDQINKYAKDGFVKIEKLIDPEFISQIKKVVQSSVLIRKGKDERELKDKTQYEQSLLQCGYLCWDFPALKDFVFAKRFAGIAKELLQVEHIRLWHDQALFKEPEGRHTDVHQDCSYWPISEPQFTITMWLGLTNVPIEKGCLYFYPRTNDPNLKEYVDIFKQPHQPKMLKTAEKVYVPLKAGDATFHSGLTFHGAGDNKTKEMREAMTIIYIKDGVTFDSSDERNRTHTSCIGLKNNQTINTKFTPILI
jgi:ectoine hydroxylase-related dioxygenase (phytanoyl-CoA dioxygenase family)